MKLGRFEVTPYANKLANGKFVRAGSVVWHDDAAGVTHDEPWSFTEQCATEAEAIKFAADRLQKLYVDGMLGGGGV